MLIRLDPERARNQYLDQHRAEITQNYMGQTEADRDRLGKHLGESEFALSSDETGVRLSWETQLKTFKLLMSLWRILVKPLVMTMKNLFR
jgi:hypothetical protein